MAVTHTTVADDVAPLDVGSAEWNASHTVADGSFVAAKLSATATDKVFGRSTAGAGNGEEIALTAAGRALIDDADAAAQRTTLGIAAAITGTKIDDLTAGDDNTDLNASTAKHGLMPKGTGSTTTFYRSDMTQAVPAGGVGAELDYVEFTSPVNVTATTEAGANTLVTGNAVAYDGSTAVWIEFFVPRCEPAGGASHYIEVVLYDGAGSIGIFGLHGVPVSGGSRYTPLLLRRKLTPSAATHTYSARALVDAGTGVITVGAGGSGNYMPGYIRITRVN